MDALEISPLTLTALSRLFAERDAQKPIGTAPGRRRVSRWPFPGPVELWIPEPDGGERYALATCENLSQQGLGMTHQEALKVGLTLAIALHQAEGSFYGRAVVRHTTSNEEGYYTGLQFLFEG